MKPEETEILEKNTGLVNPPTDTVIPPTNGEETEPSLVLFEDGIINLAKAAKWAKFIAIVTIISLVFLILSGVYSIHQGSTMRNYFGFGTQMVVTGVIYIVVAAISLCPAISFLKFANYAKEATRSLDDDSLQSSMDRLRFTFRFQGIMLIIYLAFIALALLAFIIEQASMR